MKCDANGQLMNGSRMHDRIDDEAGTNHKNAMKDKEKVGRGGGATENGKFI